MRKSSLSLLSRGKLGVRNKKSCEFDMENDKPELLFSDEKNSLE